jgi:two-component system nitrogen regulation sensor histidine kinase NtrY
MVDEFSSFARMPAPTFGPEDIRDIVRQSVFLFEVARPDIRFTVTVPGDGEPLVCDRRLLSQAVTNVVKNAVEAIDEKGAGGGAISVTVAEADGALVLTIIDDGIGLPEQRDRIAEPYMTTRPTGTGLGLAIVKKIVEDHLGEMDFADAPGGGAAVRITLYPARLAGLAGQSGALIEAAAETVPGRARRIGGGKESEVHGA